MLKMAGIMINVGHTLAKGKEGVDGKEELLRCVAVKIELNSIKIYCFKYGIADTAHA